MKKFIIASMVLVVAAVLGVSTARASVLMSDDFSYGDGILTNVSGGLWTAHSGTAAQNFSESGGAAQIVPASGTDVNRVLGGGPHTSEALYASFDVNFSVLPGTFPTYFAHFKDSSTFNFYARVFTTNIASQVVLGIQTGSAGPPTFWGSGFGLGETHKVVVRLDQSGGSQTSTLWLDPTSIGDTSISGVSLINSNLDISAFAMRQSTGSGTLSLDNLIVGTSFDDVVVPEPSTVLLVGAGMFGLLAMRRRRS